MITDNNTQHVQLSNEIMGKDMYNTEYVIMKMYCNITAGKSINFIYDILDQQAYEANKVEIRTKVLEFKAYCEDEAQKYGVEIF